MALGAQQGWVARKQVVQETCSRYDSVLGTWSTRHRFLCDRGQWLSEEQVSACTWHVLWHHANLKINGAEKNTLLAEAIRKYAYLMKDNQILHSRCGFRPEDRLTFTEDERCLPSLKQT